MSQLKIVLADESRPVDSGVFAPDSIRSRRRLLIQTPDQYLPLTNLFAGLFGDINSLTSLGNWQEPPVEVLYSFLKAFCKKHELSLRYEDKCLRHRVFALEPYFLILNGLRGPSVSWQCASFAYACRPIEANTGALLIAFRDTFGSVNDGAFAIGYPGSTLMVYDAQAIVLGDTESRDTYDATVFADHAMVLAAPNSHVLVLRGRVWVMAGAKATVSGGTVYLGRNAHIVIPPSGHCGRIVTEADSDWENPDSLLTTTLFDFWNRQPR